MNLPVPNDLDLSIAIMETPVINIKALKELAEKEEKEKKEEK